MERSMGMGDYVVRANEATVVEELREVVSALKIVAHDEKRSWGEFLEHFAMPKSTRDLAEKRVLVNLVYYRVNYSFIACAVFALFAIGWTPRVIFPSIVGLADVFVFFHLYRVRQLVVLNRIWSKSDKITTLVSSMLVMSVVSGCILASLCMVSVGFTLIGTHSVLRPRSTRSRFSSLGDAANLEAGTVPADDQVSSTNSYEAFENEYVPVTTKSIPPPAPLGELGPETNMSADEELVARQRKAYERQRIQALAAARVKKQVSRRDASAASQPSCDATMTSTVLGSEEQVESKDPDDLERDGEQTQPIKVARFQPARVISLKSKAKQKIC